MSKRKSENGDEITNTNQINEPLSKRRKIEENYSLKSRTKCEKNTSGVAKTGNILFKLFTSFIIYYLMFLEVVKYYSYLYCFIRRGIWYTET